MGIARLRAFVDLYAILTKVGHQLDWEALLERRRRERTLTIVVALMNLFIELFQCNGTFPKINDAIAGKREELRIPPIRRFQALLEAIPGATRNKIWASGLYECSRLHLMCWWILSYPFRLAVYQPPRYVEFKSWLKDLKAPADLARRNRLGLGRKND
jgi:hypothetical protein